MISKWTTGCPISLPPRRGSASSSSESSSSAAATFSSRWATDDVPGIGSITGERRSSQASATWPGSRRARRRSAQRRRPARRGRPAASGNHGMKPMPCSRRSGRARPRRRGRRGCRGSAPRRRRRPPAAASICSTDDLGQPDVADLALVLELLQLAELLLQRHLRVDAVQLEEVDALARAGAGSSRTPGAGTRGGRPAPSRSGPRGSGRPWSR